MEVSEKNTGNGEMFGWEGGVGAQREEVLLPGPWLDKKLKEGRRHGVRLEKESAVRRRQSGEKGRERIFGGKKPHKIKGLEC